MSPMPSGIVDRLRAAILRRRWAKAHRILNREATRSGAAEVFAWAQATHAELRWVRGASDRLNVSMVCDRLVPPPAVESPPPRAVPKATRQGRSAHAAFVGLLTDHTRDT